MNGVDAISEIAGIWRLRGLDLQLRDPVVMGILNLTPDSFSDGGRYTGPETRTSRIRSMVGQGARIIDIGGESTRPGARSVDAEEEWRRIEPGIRKALGAKVLVSVDTSKSAVARKALEQGAHIVNDVTALSDPDMAATVAEFGAGLVLMHMKGTPATMQQAPDYKDVMGEILAVLKQRLDQAVAAGIPREAVALDPGIGFGKKLEHNLEIFQRLGELVALGQPVVLGASRKRFLGALTGIESPERRDPASVAAALEARRRGVQVFRVHNVGMTVQALKVADALGTG